MAQRLHGIPPADWIMVGRDTVHPGGPGGPITFPRMNYYFTDPKGRGDQRHWISPGDYRVFGPAGEPDDDYEDLAPEPTVRTQILAEAEGLINGDRQQHYGPPSVNFKRIADGWNILKPGLNVTPADVARMMAWVKLARSVEGYKHDTAVDLAGYAAIYGELSEEETK